MIASRCKKCQQIGNCSCSIFIGGIYNKTKELKINQELIKHIEKYKWFSLLRFVQTPENKFYVGTQFRINEISIRENIGYFKPLDIQYTGTVEYVIMQSEKGNLFEKYYKSIEDFSKDFEPILEQKNIFKIFNYSISVTKLNSKTN